MKFLIEVLPEWPASAQQAGHFTPGQTCPDKLVLAVGDDGLTAVPTVLQSPAFSEIPDQAIVRISRITE